jgi:hypothetical protein
MEGGRRGTRVEIWWLASPRNKSRWGFPVYLKTGGDVLAGGAHGTITEVASGSS